MNSKQNLINKFKNDVMFSASAEVANLSKPLSKLGITEFTYVMFLNNGKRVQLCSHPEWAIDFIVNFLDLNYSDNMLIELNLDNKKLAIYDELSGNSVLNYATEKFGIHNAIGLFSKTSDSQEIIYFASKHESKHMLNSYLNNLDLLKRFGFYFKDRAKSLIQLGLGADFYIPQEYYQILKDKLNQQKINFSEEFVIEKFRLGEPFKNQYLTAREVECIKWCMLGKTAEETAKILHIVKRTVEAHLENAKQKLNCQNKHQLIGKALEMGILKLTRD